MDTLRSPKFAALVRFFTYSAFVLATLAGRGQDTCNVSLDLTLPSCPDMADGAITVIAGTPGLYTYDWAHDAAITTATATGLAAGAYSVFVTDTSGCTAQLDTLLENPEVAPLGTIAATNISCAGANDGTLSFTVDPGPYHWEWTDDPAETDPVRTGLGPANYAVAVYGGECTSYIFAELGDPSMSIDISGDYCPADPPYIVPSLYWGFSPDIYVWTTGATTSSLQVVPGMTGLVEVTATDTSIGCSVTADVTLTQLPSPTVLPSTPDSVCIGTGVFLHTILSNADSLVWRWGTSGFSDLSDPEVMFNEPLWQPVSLQGFDALGCGSLPVEDSVFVRPRIPALFTAQQNPCTPTVEVWLGSTADSCAFFVGDTLVLGQCYGWHTLDLGKYGPYELTFYSTQLDRCDDTASFHIDVRSEPKLFLPNSFTPNRDDINDRWPGPVDSYIPSEDYELQLFDRWGRFVWTTTDPQQTWDGSGLPDGVYGYTMRMRDPCEPTSEISKNGFVTLFR